METIDNFYKKFDGSYWAFIGAVFSIVFVSAATILYVQIDPTFSIFTHYLSDMGATPIWPAIAFNTGMIISAPIRVLFLLYIIRYVQLKGANEILTWMSFIIGFISAIGSVILAIFPYHVSLQLHMLGAFIYFIGAVFFQLFFAIIELKTPDLPKSLPTSGFTVVVVYAIFTTLLAAVNINPGLNRSLPCFWEWMGYFSLLAWLVVHGIYTYKTK